MSRQSSLRSRCAYPFSDPSLEALEPRVMLAADVMISEIMYNPASGQAGDEFIELHNAGTTTANLLNWQIADGVDFQFPNVSIPAGGYLAVAADLARFATLYPNVTNVVGGWTGQLSNSSERITLVDPIDNEIDSVRYADQGDWSVRINIVDEYGYPGWLWADAHDGGGNSLELINSSVDNELGQNWAASVAIGGTPGAINDSAAGDIAPVITDVSHWPIIPHSDDSVTVTARVTDELATGVGVTVHYRLDGAADFTTATMFDDGFHDDGFGGDGIFAAELPAQGDGAIVELYVSAIDLGGRTRDWPAADGVTGEHGANLLYQVDNSFDPDAQWTGGDRPTFRLIMTEAERAELEAIGDDGYPEQNSDAQMNGTLITIDGVGTEVRYRVGIRNRGHGSRDAEPNNYRINVTSDNTWQGVSAINLNAQFTYSQVAGAAIFKMAGLAAGDAAAANLRINNIDPADSGDRTYGLYAWVEALDSDFADHRFPEDPSGNLYKALRTDDGTEEADLRYEGPDPQAYRDTYFKNTNEAADDWTGLIHLTDVLNNAPDETFLADLSEIMDVRQWLRFIALNNLLNNRETGLNRGIGDDYAMYQGTIDPRFVPVAHDLDTLMNIGTSSTTDSIFSAAGAGSYERLLTHPDTVAIFYEEYLDLIENVLTPERLHPLLDDILGGWVPEGTIESMKQDVAYHVSSAIAQIPREFTAAGDVALVNGYYRTTDALLPVNGTADAVKTGSVMVEGQLAEYDRLTGQWWLGSGGIESVEMVAAGSVWAFLDDGSDQGTAWREAAFDDSAWASGPAQLGYGDGDEATVVGFGGDSSNKYPTTYFRHRFNVTDAATLSALTLEMMFDDAVAVYLNGAEVVRQNLAADAAYDVYGSQQTQESNWFSYSIPASLLVEGENVLAVEIHQATATSSDISFDLSLTGVMQVAPSGGVMVTPGINRLVVETFAGPDGTGEILHRGHINAFYDTGVTNNYPKIDAPTEAETFSVNLVAPSGYLPGTPMLVRVEMVSDDDGAVNREQWDGVATLTVDDPNVFLSTSQIILRNGLGSAVVSFTGGTDFTLTAEVDGMADNAPMVSLADMPVTTVSGTLAGDASTWSGVVHVTGDVLVPVGHTLTVQPGTLILIDGVASGDNGVDVDVQGALISEGTAESPVTFTAYDSGLPWGEIHHDGAFASSYSYTNITHGGNSPITGHSGAGPVLRIDNSAVTFDHVTVADNIGKIMYAIGADLTIRDSHFARSSMGPEIETTSLLMTDTFITEMHGPNDNDGLYVHSQTAGQEVTLQRVVIADMDDDGLDTLRSDVNVTDLIVRDCADKGVSIYGGVVTFDRLLSVNNDIGVSAKEQDPARPGPIVTIDHGTIVANSVGVQAEDKFGVPTIVVEYFISNSIIQAPDAVATDYDPADLRIDYSTIGESWTGTGNQTLDPQFVQASSGDYHLLTGSPCIDAGDPTAPVDVDLSVTDQGYYVYNPAAAPPEGTLSEDTTWTAAEGPYRVTGQLIVPAGVTLTVEPGTTVLFDTGASLIVAGRLVAEGAADANIHFTRNPNTGGDWGGIQFANTAEDNRITYAVIEYGRTENGMIGLDNSRLLIDHCIFDNTDLRRIRTIDSSLVVRHSVFTDIFDLDEAPTTNNRNEHIWGRGIPSWGEWIIENNYFGTITGHNDGIDFDGPFRPDPIAQIYNNVFAGGGDDALDLETDAHIEGNVFMHYHKDVFNTDPGQSNVISAGSGHEFVVVRNVFYDIDHAALVKEGSFMTFANNTVFDADYSALYFDLAGQTDGPGRGAIVEGSIFWNVAEAFSDVLASTDLTVNHSMLSSLWHEYGIGNIDANPNVVDPTGDFTLRSTSAAIGAATAGLDMGALVPAGAAIGGIDQPITRENFATVTLGGPAVTAVRYRLDGGDWSDELPAGTTFDLVDLAVGTHTLEAIARNSAGVWQSQSDPTVKTWTIDPAYARLVINEVLARNGGAFEHEGTLPDYIELYNDSGVTVDVSGMIIADNPDRTGAFALPFGTTIAPGGYLTLLGGAPDGTSGIHVGFGLSGSGDGVYLFESAINGGALIDFVEFGPQLTDASVGRDSTGQWTLTVPTAGAANVAIDLGDPRSLVINEWFADGEVTLDEDFIELYNAEPTPVDAGGLFVTDNSVTQPRRHQLPPLTFVPAGGMLVLTPDGDADAGGDHLAFKLSPYQEMIALYEADGTEIDLVIFGPQGTDIAHGRAGDGASAFAFFPLPTPGVSNPSETPADTITDTLIEIDHVWSYEQSGTDLGTAWRDPAYDDSAWPEGAGLLYVESSTLPAPKNTPLTLGEITYYFRTHFTFSGDLGDVIDLTLNTVIDDGAVIYLNGVEVYRVNMPSGTITHDTLASGTVLNAGYSGRISIPSDQLVVGDNLLAVEVHQRGATSSDVVMGLELETVRKAEPVVDDLSRLTAVLDHLKVTEVMYHPIETVEGEFLELYNAGDMPLDLTGVRLSGGIDFTFGAFTLAAGAYTVVTNDLVAFSAKYGAAIIPAGQYEGRLANSGESIVVQLPAPYDAAAMRFKYDDAWLPLTDGAGMSMVIAMADADPGDWNDAAAWRLSGRLGGSPAGADEATQSPVFGDFNGDGTLDAADIDLLAAAVRNGIGGYDLTGDYQVTQADTDRFIDELVYRNGDPTTRGTVVADADLNGAVDLNDFVIIKTNFGTAGGWSIGDFDGDGIVDLDDFVLLKTNFGAMASTASTTNIVAEPVSLIAETEPLVSKGSAQAQPTPSTMWSPFPSRSAQVRPAPTWMLRRGIPFSTHAIIDILGLAGLNGTIAELPCR